MEKIKLQGYGRNIVNGKWYVNSNYVVNRLYYVNSGNAQIHNAASVWELLKGKMYIIPKCNDFQPVSAELFDHTFFDYYSTRLIRPDTIIEIDTAKFPVAGFFDFLNSVIEKNTDKKNFETTEQLLYGFLSIIEENTPTIPYVRNPIIAAAVEIIDKSYPTVTTDSLASSLNLNKSYFIRLFKATMGISPMKYIRRCKVIQGKRFLCEGESVEKAAEKCGYSSASSFYKAVKEEFHMSPSQLRTF